MMKRKRKNRIIIAWVLLMTLMPISIVKATHHHDIEEVASSQSTDPGQKKQRERLRLLPYLPFPFISFHRIPIIPFFLFRTTYLCLYCATLSREEKDIFVVGNLAGSSLTLTFLNSLAACHVCKLLRCFRNLTPNFYIRKILTVPFSASNRLPAPTHLRMNASKQLF